jgi:CubicO group peptidase (beta-lactamase class C family)
MTHWTAFRNRALPVALAVIFLAEFTPSALLHADESSIADPAWLRAILEETRAKHPSQLPAITAAVIVEGRIAAAACAGYRKWGSQVRAHRDDPFQLCSVTKTLSSTLFGKMKDEGKLRWDMTCEEMFPHLRNEMQPAYLRVTVRELLSHQSGMPYQPSVPQHELDKRAHTTEGRRYEYVMAALRDKPVFEPGTKFLYGGGPILVASYVERKMGAPYETLLHKYLLHPLGMTRTGFGDNARPDTIDAPWQHEERDGRVIPVPPNAALSREARSPVGKNVHASIIDLARFCVMRLKGARGESHFLKAETFRELDAVVSPSHNACMGIFHEKRSWAKGVILTHNGGNGMSCSLFEIVPEMDIGVCVMMNIGSNEAYKVRNEICSRLLEMAAKGEIQADGERTRREP